MILRQLIKDTVNFIYPPVCIVTEKRLPEDNSNKYILDDVLSNIETVSTSDHADLVKKMNSDNVFGYYTLRPESQMERIVHYIKYSGMRKLGMFMGEIIGKIMKDKDFDYDYIIPVPLHKLRIRERHYNQSDYIAEGIYNITNIPLLNEAIFRIRYTKTQTHLTRAERIENVKGAFIINEEFKDELNGKRLLVIDDIITTGSTVNEVVRILKDNGSSELTAGCLAMARD